MKLSVIVPIFNVEKYLTKCLDSLVVQNIPDSEILLINDGSTDNSLQIINNYQIKFPDLIKGFSKVNGGLSDARNYGIDRAQGDYLAFIDSDDSIEPEMFSSMMGMAEKDGCDIVVCDMVYDYDTGESKVSSGGDFEFGNCRDDIRLLSINNSACNKIFCKELFEDIRFPKGQWYEDLATIPLVIYKAEKIGHVKKVFYHYYQRSGSIAHDKNEKMFEIYTSISQVKDYLTKQTGSMAWLDEIHGMYIVHGLFLTSLRIKEINQFNDRKQFFRKNIEHLHEAYPDWSNDSRISSYPIKSKIVFMLFSLKLFGLATIVLKPTKVNQI